MTAVPFAEQPRPYQIAELAKVVTGFVLNDPGPGRRRCGASDQAGAVGYYITAMLSTQHLDESLREPVAAEVMRRLTG